MRLTRRGDTAYAAIFHAEDAFVALKGGSLDVVDGQGKTTKTMVWETGKAYWLDKDPAGEMHGDMNRGKEPMEVIVVEMRR